MNVTYIHVLNCECYIHLKHILASPYSSYPGIIVYIYTNKEEVWRVFVATSHCLNMGNASDMNHVEVVL